MRCWPLAIVLAACSSGGSGGTPAPHPDPVAKAPPDAGVVRPVPVDPGNTMHLDDDVGHGPRPAQPQRPGHPIDN